jgi:hypothetical protein
VTPCRRISQKTISYGNRRENLKPIGAAHLLAALIRHIDICYGVVVDMSVSKFKVVNDDFHVMQRYTS